MSIDGDFRKSHPPIGSANATSSPVREIRFACEGEQR